VAFSDLNRARQAKQQVEHQAEQQVEQPVPRPVRRPRRRTVQRQVQQPVQQDAERDNPGPAPPYNLRSRRALPPRPAPDPAQEPVPREEQERRFGIHIENGLDNPMVSAQAYAPSSEYECTLKTVYNAKFEK
jgi:hypothetical protein